jgi:hypothetical protein
MGPENTNRRVCGAAARKRLPCGQDDARQHHSDAAAATQAIARRPTFTLTIEGQPDRAIRDLRRLLKRLLRDHGFRALDVREGER